MSAPDFSVYWLPVPVPILGMEVVDTCSKWNSVIVGDAEHWFIKIDQFCVDWATDPMATRDCRVNTIDQRWSLPPVPLPSPSSSPSGPPINGVASNSPTPSPFDVVAPSRTPGTQPTATGYVIVNQESQTCIARGKKRMIGVFVF
ncbi:hypothetical protein SARC_06256 [Sphaeroforma arctica JP610]|uniref:Uncharacterized protein n=1 Tax=Sphaeroforma arctica JP610 TaxID=667725 RepID=A0A0L0FX41_9EUKA|nr:hypothetical protein SARC_06256 [Sphaeroforma arctica JP610]KNC81415.1 hypothetical protein SARC_06256 [Sphaeroforma arctica JP610]|eukprot:XP_014155317.1 hypothetical protein SARC_06256 [Sphaeroforma arctica JP610]